MERTPMEELQDPFLAERTQKGGARSTCGFGARPASSAAAIMADYTEIFGGFSAFCSIPVLVLPEAMEGYGEALLESQSMNYSEIFGDLDAGTFPLLYEELLSTEKGSKEGDDRFQEGPNGCQFEKGVFEQLDVPIRDHIKISNVNQKCSTFYSSLNTEQLNISGRSGQKSIIDEVKSTICSFGFQANCGPDFEADTVSSTGLVEDDENPKTIETDDHILSGYMEEEKGGKEEEFLKACFVGIDGSENDLNDDHKPYKYSPLESKDKDLKQHSRSSSYHSTSSGDLFSDYSFLTVSDISLQTQPLQVPPPSRAPPKLDMKQEMPKSEVFEASDTTFSAELIPETYKGYQGHHVGVPRTRHALKETAKSNYPIYLNVEVDASSAAAASAAAIVEAMEQAQASLKSAKELMERNRESPQSGRRINSHYFGSWNEQSISFAGRLRHRTPKLAQKLVPNQAEMANPNFSEHAEREAQGKESEFSLLSDERERFHEWKIGKQFYELIGSDKLMRTRVISDEKYTRDEAAPIARQFFPEKETYGTHKKINSHSDNENKMENLHKYRSEKKLYSGGELQVQDSNAKNLKFGDTVENEEMFDIIETSDLKSVRGDDEDKQKVGTLIQLRDESKFKAEDGIRLIKHDRNEIELKDCPESSICEAGEKNEDDNKELNSHGRNDSGIMDFYSDSKLEGFGNEAVGKKLGGGKEFDEIPETSIVSQVFNYNSTSETKKFMVKLSSLENVNEAVVEKECRKSFSSDKENLEEMRDDCQLGKLNKTIREIYIIGYKEGKYSELKGIDSTSVKEVNEKFSEANISSEPEKNEKLKHEQRDRLNTLNRSETKVGKVSVWPDFLANAKDEFNLKQNEEKKKEYELTPKFENFVDKLTADEEQRKGDKNLIGKVQAAVELEKKIKRLCTDQQGLQRIRVQDDEAIQQSKSLSASVNASGSLLKQIEKSIPNEWRDANYIRNDLSDSERKEAEQKRILEEERDREREKDRIAVEKTSESCEKVFHESRERHEKFAEVSERSEIIANEVKLRVERAAVERATVEARERAIERSLAEQASLAARRQAETLTNVSKEKSRKHNTSGGIVWPGEDSEIILKPASNVHAAAVDANSQMAGLEEESPLRCKARKERHQRMVERAAKALAEKNMRDLLAQKEQVERNRLAESLDAEVKRWSNGKEGNLRALLSTLQYILGHDSGWQPIPLTEVITAAAVRKAYRKATLYVHPDKLQQRGAIIQHKYICEKVFDLLKDAWNRFNSEGW